MRNDQRLWRGRLAQAMRERWGWWRARRAGMAELAGCDAVELGRMAREFGLSAGELKALAAAGPGAADLLNKRLQALGIDPQEIAAVAGLKQDLQCRCSMCDSKSECARDLKTDPKSPSWEQYCPNEATLSALVAMKCH